ncbi:hypothetical protein [Streptomyces orinoci]|uniref:Uncharacterized protein n=1 Tax=Streptomyces orinoci TaxID=67339 RepID=A0ABV3JWD5_STRON|nr:hypothetical protein [Streptomyces orinoci]
MSTEAEHIPVTVPPPPPYAPWTGEPPARTPAPDILTRPGTRRRTASAVCAVLGFGLIAGAAAGSWLTAGPPERTAAQKAYQRGGTRWRQVPVDELFPRTVHGAGAGPGGADRDWERVGVAPESDCAAGFDPPLTRELAPAGCRRLLRATYADATATTVTTVGLLVTEATQDRMRELRKRFAAQGLDERPDLMPHPYAPPGTVAERFGDAQRASWRIEVLPDLPAVVYAVTGFTDGRTGTPPQAAAQAVAPGATTAPAQAGLGHDAMALTGLLARGYRRAAEVPEGGR